MKNSLYCMKWPCFLLGYVLGDSIFTETNELYCPSRIQKLKTSVYICRSYSLHINVYWFSIYTHRLHGPLISWTGCICVPGVDEGRRGSGRDKPATTHLTGANGTEADKNTRLLALFVFWQLNRPSDIINGALWSRIKVSVYTFYTRFSKYIQS